MKKLLSFILVLGLFWGVVARTETPKASLVDPDSLVSKIINPKQEQKLECSLKYEYSLMRQICIEKDIFSYFFFTLAALCFIGIIFAIYGLISISINILYLKIVSDFSPNKEKVKLAENDTENAEEGLGASMKIFWSSLKWVVIFVLIGLCFYMI